MSRSTIGEVVLVYSNNSLKLLAHSHREAVVYNMEVNSAIPELATSSSDRWDRLLGCLSTERVCSFSGFRVVRWETKIWLKISYW